MKILAALDQTTSGQTVLEKAVDMARQQDAQLSILLVAENFSDIGDVFDPGEVNQKLITSAREAGEKYRKAAEALGVSVKVMVESGVSPADVIVKAAETAKADLIVLGRRTKKGLDRFLIGSVASKVVAHAPCSVLVVR
ncbi:MAG: universal stress protein [Deltaproteobacteria bacterium]|nr:universal stress protein [Deltaproteobacteria bacterium]